MQNNLNKYKIIFVANPRTTLAGIRCGLEAEFGIQLGSTTVRRQLDNMLYTLKNVRFEPERANCEENKLKRKLFVEELLRIQSSGMPMVYMDETNFNLHISHTQGKNLLI